MKKKTQRILTTSVTVLAAAATAHVMQRGSSDVPAMAAVAPAAASVVPAPAKPAAEPAAELTPERQPNDVTVVVQPEVIRPDPAPIASDDVSDLIEVAEVVPPEPVAEPAAARQTALSYPEMPRPPKDALMPSLPPNGPELKERMASVVPVTAPVPDPIAPGPIAKVPAAEPEVERSEFGLSCGAFLTAAPKDAAMVGLTLTDPCRGNEVFTLEHGALTFTARLDQLGTFMGDVPAFASEADFTARFADGDSVETQIDVPGADQIDRVALFTSDDAGLAIHALEFGADYEQAGHVWSGSPRDADSAVKVGGGFVTVLGDASIPDARLAEIYTFPANTRQRDGVVRLSVEAEVTAFNCGKDVAGQTLQIGNDQQAEPVSLTLAIPGCDAIGEFLVLKNLLRDLKIASN